jgi:putative SOS response-associated peptidase YedK
MLFAFASIWTEFKDDRGTKSKPIPRPHLAYGFLTTVPNTVVEPIHPKAMPVMRRRDVWMRALARLSRERAAQSRAKALPPNKHRGVRPTRRNVETSFALRTGQMLDDIDAQPGS